MTITRTPFDDRDVEPEAFGTRYDYEDNGFALWGLTYAGEPAQFAVVSLTNPLRNFDSVPYDDPRFHRTVTALVAQSGATVVRILIRDQGYVPVELARLGSDMGPSQVSLRDAE